jgi:tetratricopeptide (TPR) repeat protein
LNRIAAAVLLAAAGAAGAQALPPAWEGELEVQRQSGPRCDPAQPLPHRIPVRGVGNPEGTEGLLLWGGMQVAQLTPGAAGHALRIPADPQAGGSVVLSRAQGGLIGQWREQAPQEPGCSFTQAVLRLTAVEHADARVQLVEFGAFVRDLYAAQAQLVADGESPEARREAARKLQALAARVPARSDADSSLAKVFLDAAELLHAMRERPAARELARAASSIYVRSAQAHPEFAALALAMEARFAYRAGGLTAASPLLGQALALLREHGTENTSAASSVLGLRGSWMLRAGDLQAALDDFGRAVQVDYARQAPAFDRAASLTNLGAALKEKGDRTTALRLLQEALALAESDESARGSLAQVIRGHIAALSESQQQVRADLA